MSEQNPKDPSGEIVAGVAADGIGGDLANEPQLAVDADADDVLFAPDEQAADGDWEPVDDAWTPPETAGDLESFLADEPAFGEMPTHRMQQETEPMKRNLLPPAEESAPLGGSQPGHDRSGAGSADLEPQRGLEVVEAGDPAAGEKPAAEGGPVQREALPSMRDAPVHPVGLGDESRASAWLLPGVVFVLGVGSGAVMYITDTNPILGAIAIGLGVVGSLFLRLLLRG